MAPIIIIKTSAAVKREREAEQHKNQVEQQRLKAKKALESTCAEVKKSAEQDAIQSSERKLPEASVLEASGSFVRRED